jgi:mono/diheme cytochrome c family protein
LVFRSVCCIGGVLRLTGAVLGGATLASRLRLAATSAMVPIVLFTTSPAAQSLAQDERSVWSGVYTAAQADRGKLVYSGHCARCHGDDLGANRAYPLAGERFIDHWDAHTLAHLFRFIRESMPPGAEARTVAESDKRDAMAYLLQQNGFPAGSAELAHGDDELASVQITGKTGPAPVKTGAIVRVAGCLAQRQEREWELTGAAEPERTTLDAPPAARRQPSDAAVSGTRTVRLLNAFPNPAAHVGHTMLAIGFLIRDAGDDAVNVVSLEMLAPGCAP